MQRTEQQGALPGQTPPEHKALVKAWVEGWVGVCALVEGWAGVCVLVEPEALVEG